jgi:hypothetical protein
LSNIVPVILRIFGFTERTAIERESEMELNSTLRILPYPTMKA